MKGRKRKGKSGKTREAKKRKLEWNNNGVTFLKRVTIELKNADDQIKVQRVVQSKGYDIIAVLPRTEDMLRNACKQLDVDIIVLDQANPDDRKYMVPNRGSVAEARQRGIYFELQY